jgi:DNA-binding transcriptional MerR regulator
MGSDDRTYGILELVQASGVPRRTIRYYVQRGLLPPPEGAGRGHFYREDHLRRLLNIRDLQDQGLTLEEILVLLEDRGKAEAAEAPPLPEIEVVTRIRVNEGIDLVVSSGAEPPTPSQIRALAHAAAQILNRRKGP